MSTLPVRSRCQRGCPPPLGAGHQCQLRGGHGGAPVVVGVHADDGAVPVAQVAADVLHLVGVGVGGAQLHRVGQVDDGFVFRRSPQGLQHLVADEHGVLHLCAGKALGGILIADVGLGLVPQQLLRKGADEAGPLHGDVDDPLHVRLKDHLPLEGGGGVVEVDDDILGAPDGLEGASDQMLPGLDQHLDGHVLRDELPLDEGAQKGVLRLRRGGKAHLDLFKAHCRKHAEELHLLRRIHRGDQGLVAVPQVHAAPGRRFLEGLFRPRPVRQMDGRKSPVLSIPFIHIRSVLSNHIFPFAREKNPGHGHAMSGANCFRGTTRVQSGPARSLRGPAQRAQRITPPHVLPYPASEEATPG